MSLPPPNHTCWSRIIAGGTLLQTRQAALMLLIKKLQSSPDPLDQRIKSLHDFFVKYERVLNAEISQLSH
jgi:hypothetical protein